MQPVSSSARPKCEQCHHGCCGTSACDDLDQRLAQGIRCQQHNVNVKPRHMSHPPDAMYLPLGSNASDVTSSVCPARTATSLCALAETAAADGTAVAIAVAAAAAVAAPSEAALICDRFAGIAGAGAVRLDTARIRSCSSVYPTVAREASSFRRAPVRAQNKNKKIRTVKGAHACYYGLH